MSRKQKARTKEAEGDEEMKREKTGQTWSIDLIIGVIIFMLIVAVFYAFIAAKSNPTLDDLQDDANQVTSRLTSADNATTSSIIIDGEIDAAKLQNLCNMPYDQVKVELGIDSDFCIYIEDQNGNLIPCGTTPKAGIGNAADVSLNPLYHCGDPIS